jgi:acetoin utilization deacetylase AcuC-like enzyme
MSSSRNMTGFWWDENCFWHSGGNYAFILPVGDLVQPTVAGGLPENPETKRRLKNLLHITGLIDELAVSSARPSTWEELLRVHTLSYLESFKRLSEDKGGELGERTPFNRGGFHIASISAGLAIAALREILTGQQRNAYVLSRPPGHHCLRDKPMGYCLLANVAVAVETAIGEGLAERIAVIDWDVHHGNGTESIFYDRADVLTISIHQENCYPRDSGKVQDRGTGRGEGYNINIPLLPGTGHAGYLHAFTRIVLPAVRAYKPDAIVVACGFDASGVDPLSRMLATSNTFAEMTRLTVEAADELCGGKLLLVHEGGYSEAHVPFCGHAVIATLAGSSIVAGDPLEMRLDFQQPNPDFVGYQAKLIDRMSELFATHKF